MGLAAEAVVETHRLNPFCRSLLRLRREQDILVRRLGEFHERLQTGGLDEPARDAWRDIQRHLQGARELLAHQEIQADLLDQRLTRLAQDIYREATASRMRAFADGIAGFPRMIRDLARDLGKAVRLEITGANTQVDRDILETLLAPLNHLLRNAVDHAIETPVERQAAGKPAEGGIWLDARHHAGMLQVTIRDDGRGIDTEALRAEVVRRGLVTADLGRELSAAELFDFLFLPSFTLSSQLTEISGRGVGLDIVLSAVQKVRGSIKTQSEPGRGTTFRLQLPLTLSVVRGLIVTVAEEAYAFPLARVDRVISVPASAVRSLESREYCDVDGTAVGLVAARQILNLPLAPTVGDRLQVVLLSDHATRFGLVVDRVLTECELVVQPIDPVLGKLRNIAAATLLDNGVPALIFDVDDVIRSIDSLISTGRLSRSLPAASGAGRQHKHVLVVDDSFTVREVERKLLENRGYRVDLAVDGMDGWNAVRGGNYDLVVTDVDMPRMNGIELVAHIRNDPRCKSLPVMIVSYKDREEDRQRGLEAGADYYLAKSSFQDDTLLDMVENLIGAP
jgi:two-component system, chemotaxis family, sensor histidine kinase and response regulator WspE